MADLASLVVRLEAETSQYTAAIKKASDDIGSFSETVGSSIADVAKTLLGLEALKQIFDFTDNVVKTVANFDVLTHALGGTTESLSQLSFAAKLFNVDDISFAFERLARAVGAVETGNVKTTAVFEALGVSIYDTNGRLKTTDQQLLDIADAFTKYNDGLGKTAAAQQIFGRSGADFIAFLDQGAEKIKEAQQEAIELGVSITAPAALAAHEFQQDMQRIEAALQGLFYRTLQEILPQFQSLADSIVEFAKHAENTETIVQELAAGFKIIGSVLIVVGTAFTVVGKVIGEFVGSIALTIEALADLTKAFTDPIGAMKQFAEEQVSSIEKIAGAFAHPVDTAKKFVSYTQDALDGIDNVLEHPIDSIKKFFQAQKDAADKNPSSDVLSTLKAGLSALNSLWSDAASQLNEIDITAKKLGRPDLQLIDQTQVKAVESAIEALAKLNDKLSEQVATYGQSGAAAIAYDLTLGKLSASVAKIDATSPQEVEKALAALEKQGKITAESMALIKEAIAAGVPPGEAFKTTILNLADQLDKLKAVDALSKLDSQLLTMTGHIQEASNAAFDLANRPLRITIQTAQDKQTFSGLDESQKQLDVTTQTNALKKQAIDIEDALGKKIADVDATGLASGEVTLALAGDEAVARQGAIAQLETLYIKAQALANATGFKSAVDQALALRDAIGKIQFNPKIVEDVDAATEAQKKLVLAVKDEKNANDDLSLQLADLAKQNAQGSLSDLEFQAKQDDARQAAIDQLQRVRDAELEVIKNNPGNAAALDDYKKLGVQIIGLQTQMNQLAKTIRTDLTDSLSNEFTDYATGAKSASDALKEFVADFTKQMISLGAKELFQKLFDTSGLNTLLGIAPKVPAALPNAASSASGLADTTAAATSLGTAITTAATTGGTAMGTAVSTSGDLAATAMGTAITTAGAEAAATMAQAIAAAGAGSSSGGLLSLFGGAAGAGAGSAGSTAAISEIAALAGGGALQANELALVGEEGPELYVSDLGEQTAATATESGTKIPDDLSHAHVIGTDGPEYIKPNASGFVVPSHTFISQLEDRSAPKALQFMAGALGDSQTRGSGSQEGSDRHSAQETQKPAPPAALIDSVDSALPDRGHDALTRHAQVIDLTPFITARLPAQQERLFARPDESATSAPATSTVSAIRENLFVTPDEPIPAAQATASQLASVTPVVQRASVESHGAPSIEPELDSNVIPFPVSPAVTAAGDAMTRLLDSPELPAAPDRLDTEVTRAEAPEVSVSLDPQTSETIVKFENVIRHEQAPLLDAREYESLLTDRYLQKRQGGGPVTAGKPYLVGEGGVPELMVPDSNGTILNSWGDSNNSRSTIVNQTNHFHISSPTGKVDRASQGQIAARTALAVQIASARNN